MQQVTPELSHIMSRAVKKTILNRGMDGLRGLIDRIIALLKQKLPYVIALGIGMIN